MILEEQFHKEMIDIYRRAKVECDYNATYFIRMVSDHAGLETAKRLLRTGNIVQNRIEAFDQYMILKNLAPYLARKLYRLFNLYNLDVWLGNA